MDINENNVWHKQRAESKYIYKSVLKYLKNKRNYYMGATNTHAMGTGEADILVIDTQLKSVEIEVKISISDLKADLKKDKWLISNTDRYANKFIYAIPQELADKANTVLFQHKYYKNIGIYTVDKKGELEILKRALSFHDNQVKPYALQHLIKGYFCKMVDNL